MIEAQGLLLDPIEQSTLPELVTKRLIKLLADGHLRAGDRLPTERDLAKQLQVGRTTVREALKLLTLGGVLEARRGNGTYVRAEFSDLLSQHLAWPMLLGTGDLDMLLEVRLPLEVQAVRLAAERATEQDLERIQVFRLLMQIQGRDFGRETELDLLFHHAIADASHNNLLAQLMHSMHAVLRQYIMLSNEMTDRIETTFAEHKAVYDAIITRDPNVAERAMKEHLALSRLSITEAFGLRISKNENRHQE